MKPSKPVRIMRLISRMNVGGPAQHAIFLTQSMQNDQWKTFLCSGFEDHAEENMLDLAAARGVFVKRIFCMRRKVSVWNDLIAFGHILWLLWKFKPDILHTHTAKAGALGRMASFFYGRVFLVHTFHGHVFSEYFNSKISGFFLRVEKLLSRKTDVIITLTDSLRDELISKGIQPRRRFCVVPLGLDLERFRQETSARIFREELGVTADVFLIGVVGRLVPIKRHQDLFEALAILRQKYPMVKLAIIGGGECESPLRSLAARLKVTDHVVFCGFRKDLEKIYPSLDLVVLCSANEGMPLCLIEAMAQGIPIVATQVGGVNDLLSDCPSCKIVNAKSPNELAGAIEWVMNHRDSFKTEALRYRKTAFERFDLKILVRNTESVYQDLLEGL